MKFSKILILMIKISITLALLWLLIDKVDFHPVADKLLSISIPWAGIAIAVLMVQLILTGVRWHYVGQLIGAEISLRKAVPLVLIGQFFNQVLPSSVGGDGVRAWLLSRSGVPIRRAIAGIVCDRFTALFILTTTVAITLPVLYVFSRSTIPSLDMLAITVPLLTLLGLLTLSLLGEYISKTFIKFRLTRPLGSMVRDLRISLFTWPESISIIGITFLVQALVVFALYLCARGMSLEFDLVQLLLLPLILLFSMIPISFAGWGVRETAMIVGLGFTGVDPNAALALSVTFGLAQLIVGLPGAIFSLLDRNPNKSI